MIDSEIGVGTGFRIVVSKDDLAARLAIVARGVSTRTAVLVLGGIQLRAEGSQLHLAATDMDLSLRASLDAQVSDEGSVVVPGRLLLDIARTLPDGDGVHDHRPEEAIVSVTAGPSSYRLHTYSSEDFPRLPDITATSLHAIDRDALVDTIARVGRSASRDESRPVLTGTLVPSLGQGDARLGRTARPRRDHSGSRAPGAGPDRRRRRGGARRAREPRR